MVVAVNTIVAGTNTPVTHNNYIYEAFTRIAKQNPSNIFIFILERNEPVISFSENIIPVVVRPPGTRAWWWKLWYNFNLPSVIKKYKADVLVTSGACSSLLKIPQCIIVEQPLFLPYHTFVKRNHLRFHRKNTCHFLQKASLIITTSQICKMKILNHFNLDKDKVRMIHGGVDQFFTAVTNEEKEIIKQQYTSGNEFFLITIEPALRPDLLQLLKAFSIFKKRLKSNMQLVIIDSDRQHVDSFAISLYQYKFKAEVLHLHGLPIMEIARITAAAYAMVYPVQFDYAGYPVLQAMISGVPVITDSSGSLREIADEAALYAEHNNFTDIAAKMMLLFKDERLRNELIAKGKEQVAKYNWQETAGLVWEAVGEIQSI